MCFCMILTTFCGTPWARQSVVSTRQISCRPLKGDTFEVEVDAEATSIAQTGLL